ncbi:MAG: HAD-IC family P-type ATPase, partial [Planctomycetota bacterium]
EEEHGFGLRCTIAGKRFLVGSTDWVRGQVKEYDPALQPELHRQGGLTEVAVACDGRLAALARLRDQPHGDAGGVIEWLRSAGWRPEVLSGDHPETAVRLASDLGIATDQTHGGLSPEGKLAFVNASVSDDPHNKKRPAVVMVGDGVNDAAALAAADIGIAVSGGAEAAMAAADAYLSSPGIEQLVALVKLAKRTLRTARRNFALSLAYNVVAGGLAAAGCVTPLVAAVLMPLSSATVLSSAVSGVSAWRPERNLQD